MHIKLKHLLYNVQPFYKFMRTFTKSCVFQNLKTGKRFTFYLSTIQLQTLFLASPSLLLPQQHYLISKLTSDYITVCKTLRTFTYSYHIYPSASHSQWLYHSQSLVKTFFLTLKERMRILRWQDSSTFQMNRYKYPLSQYAHIALTIISFSAPPSLHNQRSASGYGGFPTYSQQNHPQITILHTYGKSWWKAGRKHVRIAPI